MFLDDIEEEIKRIKKKLLKKNGEPQEELTQEEMNLLVDSWFR